jgi:hypothetical protein
MIMKASRLGAVILGILATALTGSVSAIPITYGYDIGFRSGPLTGQTFLGSLSVDGNDCPGGVCRGTFDPTSVARTLLSFNITINGISFVMSDDTGFGSGPFPDVTFDTLGHLTQIDFQGQRISNGLPYTLDMTGLNLGVDFAAFYQGTVGNPTSLVSIGLAQALPEPGTASLLAIALVGVAFARRTRVTGSSTHDIRAADHVVE